MLSRDKVPDQKHSGTKLAFDVAVCLIDAAVEGDIETVRRLLDEGAAPDAADSDGLTSLHRCVCMRVPAHAWEYAVVCVCAG